MPDTFAVERSDPDAPPPAVVNSGDGCWNCVAWERTGLAIGHCWFDGPEGFGVPRAGQYTCSSHICPAHQSHAGGSRARP